ncbi:hypothetical protein FB451DRAFT_1537538 [Mycena latifolia]|nr:hypothetical protein FB451DRAFT_1537538 [Mycena latifolia]
MSYSIVDDRDPTVSYTGTWVVGGTSHEHDGTVSSSVNAGDHFSVPFTGTGVSVYGTFDSSSAGVKTSYAIDGGSTTIVVSSSSGLDSFQQLFWKSDAVSVGFHTLVVTIVSVNKDPDGDGEGTIWFDYFNVTLGGSSSSSNSVSSSSASSSAASSSSAAPVTTSSASNAATATSAGSSASTSTTAVAGKKSSAHIIAPVVVVVVVIAILFAGFLLWRKRKQQKYNGVPPAAQMSSSMSGFPGAAPVLATPSSYGSNSGGFDPYASHAAPVGTPYGQTYSPHPSTPYAHPGPTFMPVTAQAAHYEASTSSAPSSSQRSPLSVVGNTAEKHSDSLADLKRRQQQVVDSYEQGIRGDAPPIQHVDSGVRALDPARPAAELPPVYTPN